MVFQTCFFFFLWNTKEDFFEAVFVCMMNVETTLDLTDFH